MNFGFTEEQEFLRTTARDFLAKECPMTVVREISENEPSGYRPEIWAQMAELGWLGLLIPEEYGGAGLGLVDLVVILEEIGRGLLPSPFQANLQGTLAILRAGNETQRKELLSGIAAGERIVSLAVTEEAGTEKADDLAARAERADGGYRITGSKLFVPHALNADRLIVLARTGDGGDGAFSFFLVDGTKTGVSMTPLQSMDLTSRIAEVRLDGAPAELLGEEGAGWRTWEWVRDRALVALSAEAVGGSEKVLEDSVAHAKERVQFGKPIGVHQAIKHKCADMLILVESSKSVTYYAAWSAAEESDETPLAAAMAKAYTSDAYRQTSAENIQIHGGVGFTWEYDCHYYFKRAKAIEVTYGDPTEHRERVAQLLKL
ncbi:MAG: acyl-CoA dehydrogenase family protein [Myxococcota bacterium]